MLAPVRKRKDVILASDIIVVGPEDVPAPWNTAITLAGNSYPTDYEATGGTFTYRIPFAQKKSPNTGKWYFEMLLTNPTGANSNRVGICNEIQNNRGVSNALGAKIVYLSQSDTAQASAGIVIHGTPWPSSVAWVDGDVLMFALDTDSADLWVGKNGVWGNNGNPATAINPVATLSGFTTYMFGYQPNVASNHIKIFTGQEPMNYDVPFGFHPGWYIDN